MKSYHKLTPREYHYGSSSRTTCNSLVRRGIPYRLIQHLVEKDLPAKGEKVKVHGSDGRWDAEVVDIFQKENSTWWLIVKGDLYGTRKVELDDCGGYDKSRHHYFGQIFYADFVEILGNVFSHKEIQIALGKIE